MTTKGRKILFLDIDGVLNHAATPGLEVNPYLANPLQLADLLDANNVEVLNSLINKVPDIMIVVHSSWTHIHVWETIRQTLCLAGLPPEALHGDTPIQSIGSHKVREILAWIKLSGEAGDRYLILDDDKIDFGRRQPENALQIQTSMATGVTQENVEAAISYFMGE